MRRTLLTVLTALLITPSLVAQPRSVSANAYDLAITGARIGDGSTGDDPWEAPAGIPHVIVNGVPVLREGRLTSARPGTFLRARH